MVSAEELIGRRVFSEDGHWLGEVVRLTIDLSAWRVSMVAIRLRRDLLESLGLEKPWLGSQIVWIRADELSHGTTLVLDRSLAALEGRFATDEQAAA